MGSAAAETLPRSLFLCAYLPPDVNPSSYMKSSAADLLIWVLVPVAIYFVVWPFIMGGATSVGLVEDANSNDLPDFLEGGADPTA